MHLRVVCLVDWHLEVFYYPYYKIKNAGVHELNFIHPNIYYRTFLYHWKGVGFPLIQNHSAGAHSDGQELHKKHIKL